MRIGSLFSGYGGLDLAVMDALGGTVAWHCDNDPAAARVLDHHWPDVPNLGDVTTVDWGAVEPVDVLTGGYPCQPFSHAGQRRGADDERHLWPHVREAIRRLRPRLTILENVAGHRSMGFDRVLGDMAEDGLHARWVSVRASDVGAPHRRERLFIVAHPADADYRSAVRQASAGLGLRVGGSSTRDQSSGLRLQDDAADADIPRLEGPQSAQRRDVPTRGDCGAVVSLLPTPEASDGSGGRVSAESGGKRPSGAKRSDTLATAVHHALLPTPRSTDGPKGGPGQRNGRGVADSLPTIGALLPTPTSADSKASGGGYNGQSNVTLTDATVRGRTVWGDYAPAIARWTPIIGRESPPPTEGGRLAPRFVEWLMGLPDGWVTGVGLTRAQELKVLGNGVVPQQGAHALRLLLGGAW